MTTKAGQGIRHCLEKKFDYIYILNCRGEARTSGNRRSREGGNIFGSKSRNNISIVFLIRSPNQENLKAKILYKDIGDYLTTQEKRDKLTKWSSILNIDDFRPIIPNKKAEWFNQTSPDWYKLQNLITIKNKSDLMIKKESAITARRDSYVFDSSKKNLEKKIKTQIQYFNKQVDKILSAQDISQVIDSLEDSTQFKWGAGDSKFKKKLKQAEKLKFESQKILKALYFPFFPKYVYFDAEFVDSFGKLPNYFNPTSTKHPGFIISSKSNDSNISILATDLPPQAGLLGASSFEMVHYYPYNLVEIESENIISADTQSNINISNDSWKQYQKLDQNISKSDIYYYIYGILHSPKYLERFRQELENNKPKIPRPKTLTFFKTHSRIGKELFNLHINYESVDEYNLQVEYQDQFKLSLEKEDFYKITKLKWGNDDDKSSTKSIEYNDKIFIKGIPKKTLKYKVGQNSPLDWIIEKWRIEQNDGIDRGQFSGKKYKDNDPNLYFLEDPHLPQDYLIRLIKKLTTLSLKTVDLMEELKEVDFDY